MGKAPHPLDRWRAANAAEADAVRAAATPEQAAADPVGVLPQTSELLLDAPAPSAGSALPPEAAELPRRRGGDMAIGALFGLLAAGWIALAVGATPATIDLARIAQAIALASGPLALLGIVYMLFQRGTLREARRFGQTALSLRVESMRLEQAVGRINAALDARRGELAAHTGSLLEEGGKAAERLQQISMDMRDETDLLARQTDLLRDAAGGARSDMSGLMVDLPKSLDMVRETAGLIGSIGDTARQRAEGLSEALSAIVARSQEADELIGAASGRLATQIGRIETRAERTGRTIEEAGAALARTVDASLDQSLAAIEQTRSGLDAQREAMAAMIDHSRAALDETGTAAAAALGDRLSAMATMANQLSRQLTQQDEDARRLVANLEQALSAIEGRFEALGATGAEQTADLAEVVATLSGHVENLGQAVSNSMSGARTLNDRANALRIAFDSIIADVERDLPQLMQRVEGEAARGDSVMRAVTAQAEQLAQTVERATDRLDSADTLIDRQRAAIAGLGEDAARRLAMIAADSEATVERQRAALAGFGDEASRRMTNVSAEGDAMLERQRELSDAFAEEAGARLEALRDHSNELSRLIGENEASMRSLSELAGNRLVDAILKMRDTADEAAQTARTALESVIPLASEQLAESGAAAIERAFGDRITQRIHLISDTAEAAVAAASQASQKLLTQMLSLGEAAQAMEKKVGDATARQAEAGEETISREVASLVRQLNAAAIDVAKLLSHDVPDGAWQAYLNGDDGSFTRTAVRLLRKEEAGRLSALYDTDPAFREHVARYIHDFEALLRRVLQARDGSALAVTMLSSDMGKLYVALAQAIQRLLV
jgi:ABC-type transporter Mla subunit MlaD